MAPLRKDVEISHVARDTIKISISLPGDGDEVVHCTYNQAYDLKERLVDFLGAYNPNED